MATIAASPARTLAGMEVPVIGADNMKWIELTVPSSSPPPSTPADPLAPPTSRDVASCHVIDGDPPSYLIWRIHSDRTNVLELFEVSATKEFPESGLRLVFRHDLSPFAFICRNNDGGGACLLYVLSVAGTGYVLNLQRPFTYTSRSVFPEKEVVEISVQMPVQIGTVTAVTAMPGCLFTGRMDGSVGLYQLGKLDPKAPGFMSELRDDGGIGRLWNLVSRGKVVGAVQDMVVCEVCQGTLLFVLHADWGLRIWDVYSHTRIFNLNICPREITGTIPSRLCVGDANFETELIPLAVLHRSALEPENETVTVYNFEFIDGDKIIFSPEPSRKNISLLQGRLVDMKIGCNKLWILKEDDSMLYDLSETDCKTDHSCIYGLQEDFVAEQLFQGSEHALDDIIWSSNSIFASMKDQIPYFISSIFLRRLLQPGVYQSSALQGTLLDHKKYLPDFEFQSLSFTGLKKEIFAIIESEGAAKSSSSLVYYWKNFCNRFFRYWCQNSTPYGLLVGSSNEVIGLIRKSSFSLFRSMEDSEQIVYGSSDGCHDLKISGLIDSLDGVGCELLFEVLRCINYINHQLGRAATSIFYEALLSPTISSADIISQLLKILEIGYNSSMSNVLASQVGLDATWEKKQAAHKSQRKFSVNMFLSLHTLRAKATSWDGVLDVIEKYIKYLSPHKSNKIIPSGGNCSINSFLLVQATSQVSRVMFEAAFDVLLLLGYLVNICGQVDMMQDDVARIKLKLIPMLQEIITQWLVLHFLGTTPATPTIEDFSSRLSSLHLGSKGDKISLDERLGSSDFTLACLLDLPRDNEGHNFLSSVYFPKPCEFIYPLRKFCSLIVWGEPTEKSPNFSSPILEIASLLLRHGQYEAAENLLLVLDSYSSQRNASFSDHGGDGDWCARLHLLGFCFLVRSNSELHGVLKKQKIHEAVRCFFRAASGQGASQSLQNLSFQTGFQYSGESRSAAVWRLHYYQWAMQLFEQYGVSEGACQFSLAALDQVDEVLGSEDGNDDRDLLESATTIRGRLWANVFKFSLDLRHYRDAYCAIISNPEEDSKSICLRRFIIVLCEQGSTKVLCDGTLPFVQLTEKVEQELFWKAERSDIYAKPNLYRLLYAFEAYHNNWRKAAAYMYRYSVRLKSEATSDANRNISSALQERLHALSTAINALQLVDHAYAWIDSRGCSFRSDQGSPDKRARNALKECSAADGATSSMNSQFLVDVEMMEKEYVLTSAQYQLSLVNNKYKISEKQTPENLVDILIEEYLYDMAFTIILKFWKGSALKRELGQAFVSISQHRCSDISSPTLAENNRRDNKFLLPSSEDETCADGKINSIPLAHQLKGNGQWETLELYLEKYRKIHPRLPVVVAETLLHTDPQIELPLWLVHMFKGGRGASSWGMTGQEPDAATLFRLYVDYGRYAEATNLLLEYLEAFASMRPADATNRKKMSAIWFPYTAIERLWCQLEELQRAGHMVDQCDKLKKLLHGALLNHLKQVKVDSEDAVAAGLG